MVGGDSWNRMALPLLLFGAEASDSVRWQLLLSIGILGTDGFSLANYRTNISMSEQKSEFEAIGFKIYDNLTFFSQKLFFNVKIMKNIKRYA